MGLGKFFANASRAVGKMTKPIARTVEKAVDKIRSIPVVGQVFDVATIGTTLQLHMVNAVGDLAKGQKIDKVALRTFKKTARDVTKTAKFTKDIIAFVPGVGTGIAAGLGAGVALAEGRRIDKAIIEGVKSGIPGGAIAQSAFNIASSAIEGKSIDKIAISALPIPTQAKQGLEFAIGVTRDIAAGKRVDKAAIARADNALKAVTPEISKAIKIGSSIGIAKKIQDDIDKGFSDPKAKGVLASIGQGVAKGDRLIDTGRNISKKNQPAFDLATGLMSGKKVTPFMVESVRRQLKGDQRKSFDTAVALHIGRRLGKRRFKNISSQVGYLTTYGLQGAAQHQKTAIMKDLVAKPNGKDGAAIAINEILQRRFFYDKTGKFSK